MEKNLTDKAIVLTLAEKVLGYKVYPQIPDEDFSTAEGTVGCWIEELDTLARYAQNASYPESSWNPLVNLTDAWWLVDELRRKGFNIDIFSQTSEDAGLTWGVKFYGSKTLLVRAATVERAICLGALATIGL